MPVDVTLAKRARGLSPIVNDFLLPLRTAHYIITHKHTLPMWLGTTPITTNRVAAENNIHGMPNLRSVFHFVLI